jgi:phosphoribosylglycinamide formyltransferase-1
MTTERPRLGILASGSGTTAEAVIHATANGALDAEVAMVVTNNRSAGILGKVARLNASGLGLSIGTRVINGDTNPGHAARGEQTAEEAAAILKAFDVRGVTDVLLAGYMKRVMPPLLGAQSFRSMINTHPGLLPATAGLHGEGVQERVLERGFSFGGHTLHHVSAEYDRGPKIAEHTVAVLDGDDVDALFAAVQASEKANIARDLQAYYSSPEYQTIAETR